MQHDIGMHFLAQEKSRVMKKIKKIVHFSCVYSFQEKCRCLFRRNLNETFFFDKGLGEKSFLRDICV